MTRLSREKIVFLVLGLILVCYPFIYFGHYAGDAIIHLVFGENASKGHLFEFNFGEKSSGESSVGFMLYIALLFRILPAEMVPIAVKLINYFSWLLFLYLFYRILKIKKFNKYIIAAALFSLGMLPGSVYNSMNGMENVLFGLVTLSWFYFALKYSYFSLDSALSKKHILQEIIFSFVLGAATWLRPEALPFFLVALGSRFLASLVYKQPIISMSIRSSISIIAFVPPVALLSLFIHWQTGMWIQSSVLARTMLGKIVSYHIGPFLFDPKMLIRLMAYFPITFFWILGVISFFKRDWQKKIDEFFAITLFISVIFLFTFVSGVFQLGRYMIFTTPFWMLIAARGAEYIIPTKKPLSRAYVLGIFALLFMLISVYGIETKERFFLGSRDDFLTTINAPNNRQKQSDKLYITLGRPELPIVLAGGEVDQRYRLDNRVVIRCLDGRIDAALLKYFHKSSIDYVGYLRERDVGYFMIDYSIPSFNNTLPEISLKKLKLGEYIDTAGIHVTYIGENYYRVEGK